MNEIFTVFKYFPNFFFGRLFGSLLPLYFAGAMFVFNLKKKKLFPIRFFISAFIALLSFAGMTLVQLLVLNYLPGAEFLFVVLGYFVYFVVFLLSLYICIDEPFIKLAFFATGSYALQNLGWKIFALILSLFGVYDKLRTSSFLFNLFLWLMYALVYAVIYFVFVKRILNRCEYSPKKQNVLSLSSITLLVVIVLSCAFEHFKSGSLILYICGCVFSSLSCIFILSLLAGILEMETKNREIDTIKQLWQDENEQFRLIEKNIEIINIKCHDLKHKIGKLKGQASDSEIKEIEDAIAIYDKGVRTGNKVLDTIFMEKSLYCMQKGIQLTFTVDGSKFNFINDTELLSLFGNALDNAIEATEKLAEADKKVITVTTTVRGRMLLLEIENYCKEPILFSNGLPCTTKDDVGYHGFGLKSIRAVAEKYDGGMKVTVCDGVFRLDVILPYF